MNIQCFDFSNIRNRNGEKSYFNDSIFAIQQINEKVTTPDIRFYLFFLLIRKKCPPSSLVSKNTP